MWLSLCTRSYSSRRELCLTYPATSIPHHGHWFRTVSRYEQSDGEHVTPARGSAGWCWMHAQCDGGTPCSLHARAIKAPSRRHQGAIKGSSRRRQGVIKASSVRLDQPTISGGARRASAANGSSASSLRRLTTYSATSSTWREGNGWGHGERLQLAPRHHALGHAVPSLPGVQ